jgi:hypothetical protein
MTVSTITDARLSMLTLINQAMTIAGIKKRSLELDSEDYFTAKIQLEAMLSHWQAQGLNLHLSSMVTLILEPNKAEYLLGSTAHCAETVYKQKLTSAALLGATVIAVDSVVGLSNSDNIGVWLGSGWHWTTIASISGLNITLTVALPSAAANAADVYVYTNKILRPLRIKDAFRTDFNSNVELTILSRQEYYNMDINSYGQVVQIYYEPKRENVGHLHTWPKPPLNAPSTLLLHIQRPAYIPQVNGDTLDLPQEWMLAVIYNLAQHCGVAWGVNGENMSRIEQMAQQYYRQIKAFDREQDAIVTLKPKLS